MKSLIFLIAGMISLQVNAGAPASKLLECFNAQNPQDAEIVKVDDSGKVIQKETVTRLDLGIRLYTDYNQTNHEIKATSRTFLFSTEASSVGGTRLGIDCDGGGWDMKRLKDGSMQISNVEARGEIKSSNPDDGCGQAGRIVARKALTLTKVTCPK